MAPTKKSSLVEVRCDGGFCSAWLLDDVMGWPLAIAELNLVEEGEWWVARVLVRDEQNRSKGYGSIVLQAALEAVADRGAHRVIVIPGGYSNKKKKQFNFYKKNGFVMVDKEGLFEWRPEGS